MSQTAIVMGATSGMGLRVAQLLLERGWTVGAAGRRLNELQQLQDRYPDRVKIQVIDVTAADAPQRLQELIGQLGMVDLYFHSSGYGSQNCDLKEDIELKTLETNGTGFVRMVGAAYRYSWLSIGISRALFAVPGHFFFGVLMGFFYALATFSNPRYRRLNFFLAWFAPVMAHGLYDGILMSQSTLPNYVSGILMIVFLVGFNRLRKYSLSLLDRHQHKDSL